MGAHKQHHLTLSTVCITDKGTHLNWPLTKKQNIDVKSLLKPPIHLSTPSPNHVDNFAIQFLSSASPNVTDPLPERT